MSPSARRQDARLAREGELFLCSRTPTAEKLPPCIYKDGEIILEPSGAMPEDVQARKCVGGELVDLQDGQSGAIRANRDLSENAGYT